MEELKMALESITEKKSRSFLTMLGILIGVGAVLILVTVVTGMNADMEAYYEKLGVNKVYVTVTQYDRTNSMDMTDELIAYVNAGLADIAVGVTPEFESSGTLRYSGSTNTSAAVYFGSEQWSGCNNYTLKKGRDLTALDMKNRSMVCVIGSYVAESLFGYIDPIGETLTFNGYPLKVVGVYYAKDGTAEESMDDAIAVPYTLDRAILGTDTVTDFTIKVSSSEYMEEAMSRMELWCSENIDDNTGTYTVENGNDEMNASEDETTSLSLILAGVACISLLVGGIGIMNIMLVTVTERTREIGIKKAIGAQRRVIVTQFLVEAAVLSGLGGLIGILIGYGGSLLIGKAMYDLILIPDTAYVVASAVFSIVIGIAFGLYPAVKASGLQPVDALRAD